MGAGNKTLCVSLPNSETYVCAFNALNGEPTVETFVRDGDVFRDPDWGHEFSVNENEKFLILTHTIVNDGGAVVLSRLIHKETAFPVRVWITTGIP